MPFPATFRQSRLVGYLNPNRMPVTDLVAWIRTAWRSADTEPADKARAFAVLDHYGADYGR